MPDTADILIQFVTLQRTEHPKGRRVLSDGLVQRTTDDNALPAASDPLERDRVLNWQDERRLSPDALQAIKDAVTQSGFFNLEPRLLINYCKEDPGTTIWMVNIDGQRARVVVYDPKPRRSAEIDKLIGLLNPLLDQQPT